MTKLNFFAIHVESEDAAVTGRIELDFICTDHSTLIECNGVPDTTNLSKVAACLQTFFLEELPCTYSIEQHLNNYRHTIKIFGDEFSPDFSFDCDEIQIKEVYD